MADLKAGKSVPLQTRGLNPLSEKAPNVALLREKYKDAVRELKYFGEHTAGRQITWREREHLKSELDRLATAADVACQALRDAGLSPDETLTIYKQERAE